MPPEVEIGHPELGDRFVAVLGTPDWPLAADLFSDGLDAALEAVGAARGTDSAAVAGALLFEQYAQRLVAPVLAALYRDSAVLDARLPAVRTRLDHGFLRHLAFATAPAPGPADVAAVRTGLIDENLEPAAEAVHTRTRVGRRVLQGSIANAVASSLLHMSWPDPDRARYVPAAHEFLSGRPDLATLVTVEAVERAGEPWMYTDRAACCLAFRTTVNQEREQPYCGTCPVLPDTTTRALFAQATAAYAARHKSWGRSRRSTAAPRR